MKVVKKKIQDITDNYLIEIIKYCFTLEVTISFNKTRKRLHKNERETVKLRMHRGNNFCLKIMIFKTL